MMSAKNKLTFAACALMLSFFFSCQKVEVVSGDAVAKTVYGGTLLDFLEEGDRGETFDSLCYLIETIPGLKDSLTAEGKHYTLFAVSDRSFASAMQTLNAFRRDYQLGRALSLKDLMIEPFVVTDTLTELVSIVDGTYVYDTTYVHHHYDYRAQMDSLVRRYLFPAEVTMQRLSEGEGEQELASSKYGYLMYVQSGREAASGAVALGTPYFRLIDTNGTKQTSLWINADVKSIDIEASNGWLHVLSPRHEFSFNKMVKYFQNYGNEYEKK